MLEEILMTVRQLARRPSRAELDAASKAYGLPGRQDLPTYSGAYAAAAQRRASQMAPVMLADYLRKPPESE